MDEDLGGGGVIMFFMFLVLLPFYILAPQLTFTFLLFVVGVLFVLMVAENGKNRNKQEPER